MAYNSFAYYSFEIWNHDLSWAVVTEHGYVTLRLPPQAMTMEQGLRTDFGIDLDGNPTIAEAGFAPGKWTLRGSFGVGEKGLQNEGLINDPSQGLITVGLENRLRLRAVLQSYVDLNAEQVKKGEPLNRLVIRIQHGGPSEFKDEMWWILPMGMPTDERSSARPLDWSYSMTFWALLRVDQVVSKIDKINGLALSMLKEVVKTIRKAIDAIHRLLDVANWPIVKSIREALNDIDTIIHTVSSGVNKIKTDLKATGDLLRGASFTVSSLLRLVHDTVTLPKQAKQDLTMALTDMRLAIGKSLLLVTTNSQLTRQTSAPTPVPVIPGQDLRQIAATVLGDASRWQDVAAQNGLVYPFVAWPAGGGAAASSSGLIPGTVASQGATLSVAHGGTQAPVLDPAGFDLHPLSANQLSAGLQNIVGALSRRLNTPMGYLPHHPRYGSALGRYLGSPLTVDSALAIRGEVARILRQDPRVTGVSKLSLTTGDAPGTVTVNATVQTILGQASFAVSSS